MSRSVRSWTAIAVVGLLLSMTAPVGAEDSVWTGGVVLSEYLYNTSLEASAFDTRLELDAGIGSLTVGVVYRAYQLSDPAYNPSGADLALSEIRHRFADLEKGDLHLRVGHFFSTFGRGLSIRSFEDTDLEQDTALDGLLIEYGVGGMRFTGLAGTTREALFGTRYRHHEIRAVRAEQSYAGWLKLAGSAVERVATQEDSDPLVPGTIGKSEDMLLGAELETWGGPVTFVAEYTGRHVEYSETSEDASMGHATYLAGTFELPWMTLFGEFKDFDDFEHYLVGPPTGVRDHLWALMNRATYEPDLNDERGFLVEGGMPLGDSATAMAGASEARNHEAELLHWEIFGQVDRWFESGGSVSLAGAWCREYEFGKFIEHLTVAGEVILSSESGGDIELQLQAQQAEELTGDVHEDYIFSATVYPRYDLTFATVVETSNDETEERSVWMMTEVKKLLTEDLEVSISVGSERGGLKCSGGVCYQEPEFEGARLKLSVFF